MECTVKWLDGAEVLSPDRQRSSFAMDGAREPADGNLAPRRPMELLLAGTGGCSAFDVVLILKRARQAITNCEVRLRPNAPEADQGFTASIHYTVSGQAQTRCSQAGHRLSAEKYCSTSIMMGQTAGWCKLDNRPKQAGPTGPNCGLEPVKLCVITPEAAHAAHPHGRRQLAAPRLPPQSRHGRFVLRIRSRIALDF